MTKEMTIQEGNRYHVRGWNKAAVFILEKVEGEKAILKTKRGKTYEVRKDLLYPINTQQKQ